MEFSARTRMLLRNWFKAASGPEKLGLGLVSVSPSTFFKLWRTTFQNYTTGGEICCLTCATYQERHSRANGSERVQVEEAIAAHRRHVEAATKDNQHEARSSHSTTLISLAMDYGPSYLSLPLKARLRLDLHKNHPLQAHSSGLCDSWSDCQAQ